MEEVASRLIIARCLWIVGMETQTKRGKTSGRVVVSNQKDHQRTAVLLFVSCVRLPVSASLISF